MPRTIVPLSNAKCEAAKAKNKPIKLPDGQGLYLLVKPNGTKTWRMRCIRPNGKETTLTFGRYPALSLKSARTRRSETLTSLAEGIDPVEKIQLQRAGNIPDFEKVARRWHAHQLRRGKWGPDHAERVISELETHIFPSTGDIPIEKLRTHDLLAPLQRVENRGTLDMAARLRQRVAAVMRYAVHAGLIKYNPGQDLSGSLETKAVTHHPALPLERLPELLHQIDTYKGRPLTRLALLLILHTFPRSSELRFARWPEVDFDRALWTIPPEREPLPGVKHSQRGSKMHDEHLIPLSPQSSAILREVQSMTGFGKLIWPGDSKLAKPMSDSTINSALRRMGYNTRTDVCGHGFRTMACSALTESGLWSEDAVERQMSHKERNGVRAAYIHRAEHLQQRRAMLEWWSNYLDACRVKYVPPYEAAEATRLDRQRRNVS